MHVHPIYHNYNQWIVTSIWYIGQEWSDLGMKTLKSSCEWKRLVHTRNVIQDLTSIMYLVLWMVIHTRGYSGPTHRLLYTTGDHKKLDPSKYELFQQFACYLKTKDSFGKPRHWENSARNIWMINVILLPILIVKVLRPKIGGRFSPIFIEIHIFCYENHVSRK